MDARAFEIIVERYGQRLYRSASVLCLNAEDARDAVQDTFLEAFKSLDSFRGDSGLYTWLYRILVRRISRLKSSRGAKRFRMVGDDDSRALDIADIAPEPAEAAERREIVTRLRALVADLPEKLRVALVMKYYENLTCVEIAEILGLSASRVRARISDARQRLKDALSRDDAEKAPRKNRKRI